MFRYSLKSLRLVPVVAVGDSNNDYADDKRALPLILLTTRECPALQARRLRKKISRIIKSPRLSWNFPVANFIFRRKKSWEM